MNQTISIDPARRNKESLANRRRTARAQSRLSITISYVDADRFAMDHGLVTNLSEKGMGLRGDRPLKPGTEVALFISLPDSEDEVCIPEARVSWATGRQFGIALRTLHSEHQERLRSFLNKRHR
jgi:PilZ domain-containing protein